MPRKLASFPEFDASCSDNLGDDRRVVLMKGALLSELMQQPRVIRIFAYWAATTGLFKLADEVAVASDRLAKALNLPHRAAFTTPDDRPFRLPKTPSKQIRSLVTNRESALVRLHDGVASLARLLGYDVSKVERDLGLPYNWVGQGLLHGFGALLGAVAAGHEIVLPLPQITVTLDPLTTRLTGYTPDQDVIERYAQWYVRSRISGVNESELARDYHNTRHQASHITHTWRNDRKTISVGIKEIERLLRLTI